MYMFKRYSLLFNLLDPTCQPAGSKKLNNTSPQFIFTCANSEYSYSAIARSLEPLIVAYMYTMDTCPVERAHCWPIPTIDVSSFCSLYKRPKA